MYTKTIEYDGYNGETFKDTFYFNMTEAEMMEWANDTMDENDNPAAFLDKLRNKDITDIEFMASVKDLILRSIGKKSEDGRRFIKTKEYAKEFSESEAYSNLFMELLTVPESFSDFFLNGVVPKRLIARIEEMKKKGTIPEDVLPEIEG